MKEHHFLQEKDFEGFVQKMMACQPVIAPVAKKNKFAFEQITAASQVRLDYDVTILPPKKAMFPTTQTLLTFDGKGGATSAINPKATVLLGVHPYDVKAIDMLDKLFREPITDNNYLANREAITIIASNVQKLSDRAFFGSVSAELQPVGHDVFMTKIGGGYLFETLTEKGKALLPCASFQKATSSQIDEAAKTNKATNDSCKKKLKHSSDDISKKVRASFKDTAIWDSLSENCFSCGSCNVVCPTCYCFDVQDEWNLDQVSGTRVRKWDSCMLREFSTVSLGGGHEENFRETAATRTRHRVMRKTTYLNDRLGGPACVGCGRCSVACVPDIADPVEIINKIMEASHD
jgi:hypothetical protein